MATITVAELATTLDTDPRTTRKFLRSITPRDAQPGKGSRWAIEKREVRSLRSKFTKWTIEQDEARKARQERAATAPAPEVDEAVETADEPTAEELESIETDLEPIDED